MSQHDSTNMEALLNEVKNLRADVKNLTKETPSGLRLDGKVAIVTGAGRGIGRGVAIHLASRGASVVLNYANSDSAAREAVEEIEKNGGKAIAIKADVTKVKDIDRLFKETIEHFGKVNIVCSNSGMECFETIENTTEALYDQVFALNTKAQFFVGQAAYRYCEHGGRLVLMSSIAAKIIGPADHYLYAGSKSAVEGFVRTMSFDFGKKGMTVNAIAPGGVKTDMFSHAAWRYIPGANKDWKSEDIEAGIASASPLGRVATPVDIAYVVSFLASKEGEWINGQIVGISGGAYQ